MQIPLARPTFYEEDIRLYEKYIEDILRSGRLTLGKYLKKFEEMLREFIGAKYAIAMSSCTAALHAIMWSLNIKSGDEVIVPTYTFASTVNSVIYVGAKPVLVDSDLDTFNISIDDVANKISSRTKAIIAVHVGGNPADLRALLDLAEDHDLVLIEDAAHALGSYYYDRHVGTFSKVSAFSFYPNKIITTGEGGAAVTDDTHLAEKLKIIRCVGRTGLGPTEVIDLGHNFRMSELQAALGLVQMRRISEILDTRRRIATYYNERFKYIDEIILQQLTKGAKSSYYAYIVRIDEDAGISRDDIRKKLQEDYGIETTIIYKPIHLHQYYKNVLKIKEGSLPNAELLGRTTLALPIYGHMSVNEAEYVINAIEDILSQFNA